MERTPLSPLFDFLGGLGGLFIVATLLIQLTAIIGRPLGFTIDGYDAYAGYFLAAGSFLAFAHTLVRGDHIRVTLVIGRLRGKARIAVEIACLVVAVLLTGYFAWFSVRLAWGSYHLNDISQNIDATPLWIPQLSMAVGVSALALAFVEQLVMVARRKALPETQSAEIARTE